MVRRSKVVSRTRLIVLDTQDSYARVLAFMEQHWQAQVEAGRPMVVELSAFTEPVSIEQRREFAKLMIEISDSTLYQGNYIHPKAWEEIFRSEVMGTGADGERLSTVGMSRCEFADFRTGCEVLAIDCYGFDPGVQKPGPLRFRQDACEIKDALPIAPCPAPAPFPTVFHIHAPALACI